MSRTNPAASSPEHPVIADTDRLRLISRLGLRGHLGDEDLNAVVLTLVGGCQVPIAVVNIVTPDLQTYPAEIGVGRSCTRVPDEVSFCAEVVRTSQPLSVPDASAHDRYSKNPLVMSGAVRAYAGEPLVYDGHVIGTLSIFDSARRTFTDRELELLRAQAQLASSLIQLRANGPTDRLTGLGSRGLLLDRAEQLLAHSRRSEAPVALVVLDIADIAGINETYGVEGGDAVLLAVADRLRAAAGADVVFRSDGDSFAVLLEQVGSVEDAKARAAELRSTGSGEAAVGADGEVVAVELRAGLATSPNPGASTWLASAERSANRPLRTVGVASSEHAGSLAELRTAIDAAQLVLFYQPVIDLAAARITGVEALVRWQHPHRGLLPPSEFIALAEDGGLIEELGWWVLTTAAAQALAWQTAGRPLTVAVNLSPKQLAASGFATDLKELLARTDLAPNSLVLEVTESALIDHEGARDTLAALSASGSQIALDDFGTGYSSLAYLRQFPVDIIKIDRSFVAGLGRHHDDDAIVASIVSLAANTDKTVIAEGVETDAQLGTLRALGVQSAQGFLWSRPVPAAHIWPWADANSAVLMPQPTSSTAAAPRPKVTHAAGSVGERILTLHHAGASLHTIAAKLNSLGEPTADGRRWHARSVAHVISTSHPHVASQPRRTQDVTSATSGR